MTSEADRPHLVFVHGVGGSRGEESWRRPLSDAISSAGHSRPELSDVGAVTVHYRDELIAPGEVRLPRPTRRRSDIHEERSRYQVRRAELEALTRSFRQQAPPVHLGRVGDPGAEAAAALIETAAATLRREARRYRTDSRARAAVQDRVLGQVPTSGRVVLIGHSLGSVVATDLVRRLPTTVTVELLLTVGSPLSLRKLWPFVDLDDDFPFDRIRGWVNVFDSRDPVTAGRGIGHHFPEAVDVDVHLGRPAALVDNHAFDFYLSLPLVGALVGHALYGAAHPAGASTPTRRHGPAWDLYLLASAFASQVSRTCDGRKHRWRRTFDAARHASVSRLLGNAASQVGDLPDSAREVPSHADFTDHAAALVKGTWTDDDLVPYAVALLLASPVKPFEIDIAPAHGQKALASVLNRIRRDGSQIADHDFAEALVDSLADAREVLGARGPVWAYLLLGGAAVLAATGVGVWAAAPAGVAGAAMLTATLAAFGPGGMVGGMITIAAASGVGSALLGAGAMTGSEGEQRNLDQFAGSLADLDPPQLRSTCTALVAVALAQRRLGLRLTASQTATVLTAALTQIENEENAHLGLGSSAARGWTQKKRIVDKTLAWLATEFPSDSWRLVKTALEREHGPLTYDPTELAQLMQGSSDEVLVLPPGDDRG